MKGENRTDIEYPKGLFTEVVLSFLEYKRSLGYKYDDGRMYTLRSILKKLNSYKRDKANLTKEMVFDVIEKRENESDETQIVRVTLIRQLAIFMEIKGYEAYILPPYFITYKKTIFKAFIYTEDEIIRLINVCDEYCKNSNTLSLSSQTVYPFFIRVLYGGGLRISEALRLKGQDVDLKKRSLFIRESKCYKSRYIPMSNSLVNCLRTYEELKKERCIQSNDDSYFPSPDGYRFSKSAVSRMIKMWICQSQVRKTDEGVYPRIHDLRHTAAVRILENLDKNGQDLNINIPLLSVFLGHDNIVETEQYLQFPVYSFNRINEQPLINSIIPEVGNEYEK